MCTALRPTVGPLGVMFCLLLHGTAAGQNLVPNDSYEIQSDCSSGPEYEFLQHWTVPFGCSYPGYCNACAQPPLDVYLGVPQNLRGFEYAHTGQAYIMLQPYGSSLSYQRSFATVQLYEELETGMEYCVSFWMSWCDSSTHRSHTFHALFTPQVPFASDDNDTTFAGDAQVVFNTATVDGNGWYQMEGSFIAEGGERRITLGDFLRGEALLADLDSIGDFGSLPPNAAYYIDDVYVARCDVGQPERARATALTVWPNPVEQGTPIACHWPSVQGSLRWQFLSIRGELIAEGRLAPGADGQVALPTEALIPGCYQLILMDGVGHRRTEKMMVR